MNTASSFSVVQTTRTLPHRDRFVSAVVKVNGLTAFDATNMYKRLPGVIATGLTSQQATSLERALAANGIPATVISTSQLSLPQPRWVKHMQTDEQCIHFTDSMENEVHVEWSKVKVVTLAQFSREQLKSYRSLNTARGEFEVSSVSHRLENVAEQFIEFLSDSEHPRIRVQSPFSKVIHEGGTVEIQARDVVIFNKEIFLQVLERLSRQPRGVLKNLALEQYIHDANKIAYHSSPVNYELEVAWLKWLSDQPVTSATTDSDLENRFSNLEIPGQEDE